MQSIYRKQPQSEKAFKLQLPSSVDDPASLGSEDIGKPENISAPESSPDPESETFEDAQETILLPGNVWDEHSKHIFVISEAGKPIYSLHGEEEYLVSLGGIMQALVSFVADTGDAIRSIRAGHTQIVFLVKSPLILVAVSRAGLSAAQLTVQLTYIHNQILSTLTAAQLERIFVQRRNYDLRRMLQGSERLMTHLSEAMDSDPSFLLSAVRCLPLAASVRDNVSESIIRFAGKVPDVVFGILIAENQLVTLVRMKKYFIHPADLHLVFNLINSTESFKHSESWTPICLPKFDSGGFLHAHVSYLTDDSPACLLLLTLDRNAFFDLSAARGKIIERMERHGSISAIQTAIANSRYTTQAIELPEMRHFLYKSRTSAQFTSPEFAVCYQAEEERRRLCGVYLALQVFLMIFLIWMLHMIWLSRIAFTLCLGLSSFSIFPPLMKLCLGGSHRWGSLISILGKASKKNIVFFGRSLTNFCLPTHPPQGFCEIWENER